MKDVCIPLADGFEEIEAVTLIDVLRRAGLRVSTCGLRRLEVCGSHSIRLVADMLLEEAVSSTWDLVALPGGMPGATHLCEDARVGRLLTKALETGGWVGAICAAPIVLARFGLLEGRRATSYPGFADRMPGAIYCEDRVVCDGKIITSRGPGTALEFALELVRLLAGAAQSEALKKQMQA